MSTRLRKNPRVRMLKMDEHAWGLYNLETGEHLFIDDLSRALIDIIESFDSKPELIQACQALDVPSLGSGTPPDFRRRIESLERIGLFAAKRDDQGRVLLVDPPAAAERQAGANGPAMALCYLSAALKRQGLPAAHILDLRSVSSSTETRAAQAGYFADATSHLNPRVVGITAVSATIETALLVARLAKTIFPDCLVVIGGPHASYEWQAMLDRYPFIDAIVRGEGEIPFPLFVERVLQGGMLDSDLTEIPGLAWRSASGEAISSGWCRGVPDLDSLQVPDLFEGLLNASDYTIDTARLMSSRGCPFTCSFCSTATFTGRRVRYRSVASVMAEITFYWEKHGLKKFTFDDDIFTVNRKRSLEMCNAIENLPFHSELEWGCNTRLDCLDMELLASLHRAGCRNILFGVESGDIDVQNRFGKGKRSLLGFREKIAYMLEHDMGPQLNFILGLPGESCQTIDKIISLVGDYPAVPCGFNFLSIYPGTPLEKQMDELGIELLGEDHPTRYSLTAPTLNTPSMPAQEQLKSYLRLRWQCKRRTASLIRPLPSPGKRPSAIDQQAAISC